MKNSTFKENVRKQLEANKKVHAMGLDVWYDGNFKHVRIYKTYKNEYNQDNIKFIGYIDDNFNIVINELFFTASRYPARRHVHGVQAVFWHSARCTLQS